MSVLAPRIQDLVWLVLMPFRGSSSLHERGTLKDDLLDWTPPPPSLALALALGMDTTSGGSTAQHLLGNSPIT